MAGVTLDAGPLVLLDKGDPRMLAWYRKARERRQPLAMPATALAESWRGGPRAARLARALPGMDLVDVDEPLAKAAGLLLAHVPNAGRRRLAVDAIVVACAQRRGDAVLTVDPDDVGPLAAQVGVPVIVV